MTDRQKQWIAWGVAVLLIAILGYFGITLPNPVPPTPQPVAPQVVATAIYPSGAIYFAEGGKSQVFQSGSSATYKSGSTLTADSGANVTVDTITATTIISTAVGFDTTGNGTAAAPAYTFASDPDTGLYRVGTNNIGITTNGTKAFDVSATTTSSALPVALPAGSAAAPSATFTGDVDTGIYHIGANNIGIATNGVLAMDASATAITFGLPVKGPAEGTSPYELMVDVTAANINSGHTVITVPAARVFRLVDAKAVAYGATCTTSTSVLLKGGTNTLVTYTVANLTRSTLLGLTSTGVAVAADGASFTAQAAGDDVTVISNSADTAGCTGVRFIITYALD